MVLYRKKDANTLEEVSALQIRIFNEAAYTSFFTASENSNGLITTATQKSVTASTNDFVDGEVIGIVNHGMFKVSVNTDTDKATLDEITNDARLRTVESKLSTTTDTLDSVADNSVKKSDKDSSGAEQTQTMLAPLTVNETFKAGLAGTTGKYALRVIKSASLSECKTTVQGQLEVENAGLPSVFGGNLTVKGQLAVGSIVFTSS